MMELTTWQRLTLLQMLNEVKGDLRTVRKALKLIDVFEMTEQERTEVGLRLTQDGAAWSDPSKRWQLNVSDNDLLAFLKEQVQARHDWPASREVLDLCERLGINAEDDKQ